MLLSSGFFVFFFLCMHLVYSGAWPCFVLSIHCSVYLTKNKDKRLSKVGTTNKEFTTEVITHDPCTKSGVKTIQSLAK